MPPAAGVGRVRVESWRRPALHGGRRVVDARPPGTDVADPRRRAPGQPSPAVAPPPGNPRFPLFDSLRGLAVLARDRLPRLQASPGRSSGAGSATSSRSPAASRRRSSSRSPASCSTGRGSRRGPGSAPPPRTGALPAPARAADPAGLLARAHPAGDLSRDHRRLHGRLVALLLLPPALRPGETLGLGISVAWTLCVEVTVLPPAAALGVRGAAPGRGRASCAQLGARGARGAAVQVAAGRRRSRHAVREACSANRTWFASAWRSRRAA